MSEDKRTAIYQDLHHGQLVKQEAQDRAAADTILSILFEHVRPQSVLDVGCGLGTWLSALAQFGIADIHGVEGTWLDRALLLIDPARVTICDLEQGVSLGRRFDLTICVEVAEHLSERAADTLVAALVQHSDLILFSAAIPHQGGRHHVNERFPDYWAARFAVHGCRPLDFIRPRIWTDQRVLWWLRQNTLVFAHDRLLASNDRLRQEYATPRLLSVVHPDLYMLRLQEARDVRAEHQKLIQLLSQGGTFSVAKLADGRLTICKV